MSKIKCDGDHTDKPCGDPECWLISDFNGLAENVAAFYNKFNIQYDGPPRMLPPALKYFRHQRNEEECKELYHAPSLEMVLDAIVDQIYILLGTAHLHGFTPHMIQAAWDRVHVANMLKVISTPDNPGKYGTVGQDIVKPLGWVPPDLSDIINPKKP